MCYLTETRRDRGGVAILADISSLAHVCGWPCAAPMKIVSFRAMSLMTIFICSGLLVYWVARTVLLLHGTDEVIDKTLECDLWWGRTVLLFVRSGVSPSQQFIR